MKGYLFLAVAIILEVIGTSALKASEQFTKLVPGIVTAVTYIGAFYFLSLTLKTIPVGISYAIWSGIGIVLITLAGIVVFKEIPDLPAIVGMVLIITGVLVIHIFSKATAHG
jgi:small multidrug resistance pump